jgi:hypothetical protein
LAYIWGMKNNCDKDSMTLREFLAQFPDDESCLQHVFDCRFGQGHKYAKEFEYRFNSRNNPTAMFSAALLFGNIGSSR